MMKQEDQYMRIAVTGGIGSGKSFVCRLLEQRLGVSIYDCDAAAKRLMRASDALRRQLTALIGPDAYTADGLLNKAAVAQFLLSSEQHTQALNAIVHPAVARDFLDSGQHWMECAILFESGFDRLVQHVVVVTAPPQVRLQRIMQRDGISHEKARQWMDKQWPQEELLRRADYEIRNDGREPLEPQIENLLRHLQTCKKPF